MRTSTDGTEIFTRNIRNKERPFNFVARYAHKEGLVKKKKKRKGMEARSERKKRKREEKEEIIDL